MTIICSLVSSWGWRASLDIFCSRIWRAPGARSGLPWNATPRFPRAGSPTLYSRPNYERGPEAVDFPGLFIFVAHCERRVINPEPGEDPSSPPI